MALTLDPVPTTVTTATAKPDKPIAVRYVTGGAGAVLYTVPAGRKFKGILTNTFSQTGGFPVAQINGNNVDWVSSSGPLHIELAEGAIVQASNASYATGVYGVESDA